MKAADVGVEGLVAAAIIGSLITFQTGFLRGPDSPIGALACLTIGDRSVLAAGAFNGTVMGADLLATQTAILSQTPIRAVAPAAPDHCVTGTDNGLISRRIPAFAESPLSSPTSQIAISFDITAAETCPARQDHRERAVWKGTEVTRLCLEGVVSGARSGRGLANASGHCHIFPDLEITRSLPGEDPVETGPELVLPIRDIYVEPLVEDHDAHLTNDCHFGVAIDSPTEPFLILSCYRRSERDWLIATLHRVRTARTFPLCPRRD